MKVLNREELLAAEEVLLRHLPRSFKVYGFVFGMNRNKPSTLQVVADSWPDFKVTICRPDPESEHTSELHRKVTYYSLDEKVLREMLSERSVIDWSSRFFFGGVDMSHGPILRELSSDKQVNTREFTSVHLLYLPDSSRLVTPALDSELGSRISSLNLSHVDTVNKTWKFGRSEAAHRYIENLISNFPSCCITDDHGQPVSWILVYDYCAMGLLYTLPEHRGKGYAKVLISTMARKLRALGYPVYCFIELDNKASYMLFKNLGFIEDPSYRAAWFEINF